MAASVWCRTCSSGRTLPVASARSSPSRWRRWHRRHAPAISRPVLPQAGQLLKKSGPGTAQSPHRGASRVPARAGASCPHFEHCAHERAHAPHRGWPVILETVQGAVRPQLLQVRMSRGLQVAQTGPAGVRVLTCLRRRQRTHSSRLTGSVTRQYGHNGRPWPSRAAGSRTVPHFAQGTARARAQQFRQILSPSRCLPSVITRRQRGQAGRLMRVAPASQRASMSLSTTGNGAFAPSPVSSSGLSCRSHASFCR